MKTLVVEDDLTSRIFLQEALTPWGEVHVAVNGREAVVAFARAQALGQPYDLICMDILMPGLDGLAALKEIRRLEEEAGTTSAAKVLMTSVLGDKGNVMTAFREQCDGYLIKPFDQRKLTEQLARFGVTPKG
jgi:two-component system chemotaxis response regulator CheY